MKPMPALPQPSLLPDPQAFYSKLILRKRDFETLFEGFDRLKAVSYVASPDLLLELFDRGYTSLEVVVGENLTEPYRQDLAQKGLEVTQRLAERMAKGELKIFVPDRTLHTKLYILERDGQRRVILTSANLTETARRATRQVNYAWYADLPPEHPWLDRVEQDYKAHRDQCTLFMGELTELLRQSQEEKRRELIETWLKSVPPEEVETETRRLLEEISRLATERGQQATAEPLFSVRLPDAPAARRQAERLLSPLSPLTDGSELRLSGSKFIHYVQEAHGIPVLRVDIERRELRLGLDGSVHSLSEPLPGPTAAAQALRHLEDYFQTVDMGQAPDPRFAKVSMFEALLYMFSAPFANEYMRLKRRHYGLIDSRGPRFLYIYGPSHNGKSTFLRFALRLITGRAFEPLRGAEFTKRKVVGAASIGTAFPVVFDDLPITTRQPLFEEILKSYWELWWNEETTSPQIMLSSNAYTLRDWAKSRVKRLDFDVQFSPSGPGREALARIFKSENPVFRWFSLLYIERLLRQTSPSEDELAIARNVFEEIYRHANRPLPDYFPTEPIEKLYDPGRKAWQDLLGRLRKARVDWERDRASVHFAEDLQYFEIKEYENSLPPGIKHKRHGKALIIESQGEFKRWLGEPESSYPWWSRIFRRFP